MMFVILLKDIVEFVKIGFRDDELVKKITPCISFSFRYVKIKN